MNTSGESNLFQKHCFLCSKPLKTRRLQKKCSKAHLENYEKYVQKHEVYKHIFNVNSVEVEYGSYEGQVFSTCPPCCDGVDNLLLLNTQMEELEIKLGHIIESLTTEILQNRIKYSDPLAIEPEPEDNTNKTEVILSEIADVVEIKKDLIELDDEDEDCDFKDFNLDFPSPSSPESCPIEAEGISENTSPAVNHGSHIDEDVSKTGSKDAIYSQIALREIRIVLERIKMPYSTHSNTKSLSMKKSSEPVAGDYCDWSNNDVPFKDGNNSETSENFDADSRMRPRRNQRNRKTKYQSPPVNRTQREASKLYNCEICGDKKKPMTKKAFREHIMLHPKYKPFVCNFPNCVMKFRWPYALTRHENEHLGKESSYTCEICGNNYKGPYELRKHKQRVHVEADQVCKICGNKYKLIQNLMVHVKRFHGMTHLEYADKSDMAVTPFCGEICHQYYSSVNMLDSHNKRFHSEVNDDFFCEFCEETVTPVRSLAYINRGNIKLHTIGKIIKCRIKNCESGSFNCTEMYQDHRKNHKRRKRNKLKSRNVFKSTTTTGKRRRVNFNYAENDNLSPVSNNDGDNDGSEQYECKKCEKVFAKISNLKRHIKLHKNVKFSQEDKTKGKCEICDKMYTKKSLPRHIRMHNRKPKILVKCPVCEKDFKSPSYLLRHSKIHSRKQLSDEEKLQLRTCKICGKEFKSVKVMNGHFRNYRLKNLSEEDKKVFCPFICEICGMRKTTILQLKFHVSIKHPENKISTNEFFCEKCGKSFSNGKNLKRHIELHKRKMKDLICPICGKVFNFHRSDLKKHIQTHANTKISLTAEELLRKRTCPICEKVFKRVGAVRPHIMNIHRENTLSVEERAAFMCHQCGKSLASSHSLNRHIFNVHSDDRSFKCTHPGCDKEYKEENSLKYHIESHSVEANYECSICGKKFFRNDLMQLHFRRNHDPKSKQYLNKQTLMIERNTQP